MDNSQEVLGDRNDVTGWDTEYARQSGKVLLRLFRNAYGDDYPEEVQPYSSLTKTDLADFTKTCQVLSN